MQKVWDVVVSGLLVAVSVPCALRSHGNDSPRHFLNANTCNKNIDIVYQIPFALSTHTTSDYLSATWSTEFIHSESRDFHLRQWSDRKVEAPELIACWPGLSRV